MVPKLVQKIIKKMTDFGTCFAGFVDPFWGPKRAKTSQDGLPKRSKRANIAISSDFENMHFIVFFKVILEHQTSQKTPNTAQKPPKMDPDSLQEPSKNKISF